MSHIIGTLFTGKRSKQYAAQYICDMANKLTFFNYAIQNSTDDVCDIHIDGVIVDASTEQIIRDWWNDDTPTSFKSIRNQIGSKVKTVNVYVNSGGGQVVEAMAIHDYMKTLQKNGVTVNTYGRGLIASAATYILMSSSNSNISKNSWFMVHNVSGGIYGDVNEIENYAVTMRKFNDQITDFYSSHTGLSNTVVKNMMNKETWFTGQEAKDKGFVKNVELEDAEFTNAIDPANWMFNNTEVVKAYNSFTQLNTNSMDIKKMVNDALKELGFGSKPTNELTADAVAEAISNALQPLNDIDKRVADAVNTALQNEQTIAQITNGLAKADALANLATKEEVKDFATKQEVTELTNEIATLKGTEAGANAGNPGAANNKGVTWES